jgi:hypothetical protein
LFKKRYFARLWEETTIAAGLDKVIRGSGQPALSDLRGTTVTLL